MPLSIALLAFAGPHLACAPISGCEPDSWTVESDAPTPFGPTPNEIRASAETDAVVTFQWLRTPLEVEMSPQTQDVDPPTLRARSPLPESQEATFRVGPVSGVATYTRTEPYGKFTRAECPEALLELPASIEFRLARDSTQPSIWTRILFDAEDVNSFRIDNLHFDALPLPFDVENGDLVDAWLSVSLIDGESSGEVHVRASRCVELACRDAEWIVGVWPPVEPNIY